MSWKLFILNITSGSFHDKIRWRVYIWNSWQNKFIFYVSFWKWPLLCNRTNIINDHGVYVKVTFSIFQPFRDYQTYCGTENNMTVVTNLQMKSTTTCKFHNILTLSVVYIGEWTHLSGVKPVFRGQRHESIGHPSSPYKFIFATPMCPLKCL